VELRSPPASARRRTASGTRRRSRAAARSPGLLSS